MRVVEGFSGHLFEWLIAGKLDVAVLYNAPRTGNLRAEPLVTEEISLLGPVGDPASIGNGPVPASRLAKIPLILPSRPHGLRLVVDTLLGELAIQPRVELERSEEQTSELQSLMRISYAVFCLKKKITTQQHI